MTFFWDRSFVRNKNMNGKKKQDIIDSHGTFQREIQNRWSVVTASGEKRNTEFLRYFLICLQKSETLSQIILV